MSQKYPDLIHTNFPEQMNDAVNWRDPSASEQALIRQYKSLLANGQDALAQDILNANPHLMDSQINAEKLLALQHGLIATQRYFYDNIQEHIFRIGNLKGDWNAQMSSTASGENKLDKLDVVRYPVDGIKQYFLVYGDNLIAGINPLEAPDKYLQMSIKGDKGDKGDAGYTPQKDIDYRDGIDGVDGIGMSPKGAWVNNRNYFQYDVVSHNGIFWYALEDNIHQEPSDASSVWDKFNISMQVTYGTDIPQNLENGGIWMHLQEDGHIILKTKNENGEYIPMYPETQADYINDKSGDNLQRIIYRHYFDREDVVTSFRESNGKEIYEAKQNNVIVAKIEIEDKIDDGNNATETFTVYDATGIFVMYQVRKIYTENNGVITCTPTTIL